MVYVRVTIKSISFWSSFLVYSISLAMGLLRLHKWLMHARKVNSIDKYVQEDTDDEWQVSIWIIT